MGVVTQAELPPHPKIAGRKSADGVTKAGAVGGELKDTFAVRVVGAVDINHRGAEGICVIVHEKRHARGKIGAGLDGLLGIGRPLIWGRVRGLDILVLLMLVSRLLMWRGCPTATVVVGVDIRDICKPIRTGRLGKVPSDAH